MESENESHVMLSDTDTENINSENHRKGRLGVIKGAGKNYMKLSKGKKILFGVIILLPLVIIVLMIFSFKAWSLHESKESTPQINQGVLNVLQSHKGTLKAQSLNTLQQDEQVAKENQSSKETNFSQQVAYQSLLDTQRIMLTKLKTLSRLETSTQSSKQLLSKSNSQILLLQKAQVKQSTQLSSLAVSIGDLKAQTTALNKAFTAFLAQESKATSKKAKALAKMTKQKAQQAYDVPFKVESLTVVGGQPYVAVYNPASMAQKLLGVGDAYLSWSVKSIKAQCIYFVKGKQEIKRCI